MNTSKLLSAYRLGSIELKNRMVMAPMTRSRAIGNVPNDLMATYYRQRAGAGLIITEGTSPSPNGLGYARIPGIFSDVQVQGWRKVTGAVHEKGGKIFVQLMHTGRITHALNLPYGAVVVAPSAVGAAGTIWTDAKGLLDHSLPREMSAEEVAMTKNEYIQAGINAVKAGFDGVELHGANGYLLEQFLSPFSNLRTDRYGGSMENRCRFLLEVVEGVAAAIGKEKTGIRLSPYGINGDMPHYDQIDATYAYLAEELDKRGILYIHLLDVSAFGVPGVPSGIKGTFREKFSNTLIFNGALDKVKAEEIIAGGAADLIAFGRPFINNPDLVVRFENQAPLSDNLDMATFYTADEKGYIDYKPATEGVSEDCVGCH
jgi:N-ethylmaleimide reductase